MASKRQKFAAFRGQIPVLRQVLRPEASAGATSLPDASRDFFSSAERVALGAN